MRKINVSPPLLHISNNVCLILDYYGIHITKEGHTLISDKILVSIDDPSKYKEEMVGLEAAKWKDGMESEI